MNLYDELRELRTKTYLGSINLDLAEKLKLSRETIEEIQYFQDVLNDCLNMPDAYDNPVEFITEMEFKLQELWGFPQDNKFHRHWNKIKGCECPDLDNYDALGTGRRYINGNCKWHG